MTFIKYYFEHIKDGQISEGYTAINIVNYEAEISNDDPDAVLVARKNDGAPKETPKWEERFRPSSQPMCGFFWLTDIADLESLSKSDIGEGYFEIGMLLDIETLADVIYDHLPRMPRGHLYVERVGPPNSFRLSCGRWGFLGDLQLSKRGNATILRLDYVPLPSADELSPVKMLGESHLFQYGKRKHRGEVIRRLFDSLRHDPIWQGSKPGKTPMTKTSILFLAADPTDVSRLRLGEEVREIQEKLQLAKMREQFELHQRFSVRPPDISQALLDIQPKIVHFAGHGTNAGTLCFENQIGEAHSIQPEALAVLFEQFAHQINCVLLNACYSEVQAKAIAKHIDYVIGMNQAIGDKAAIAFAVGFYQALGAGRTIEDAYKLGCVQIRLQNIPEHLTPILIKK